MGERGETGLGWGVWMILDSMFCCEVVNHFHVAAIKKSMVSALLLLYFSGSGIREQSFHKRLAKKEKLCRDELIKQCTSLFKIVLSN